MTEGLGRKARWTALLAIAPGTAGLFAATTAWAAHTVPTSSKPATPAVATPTARQHPRTDPAALALVRTVAARKKQADDLQKQLTSLRQQLKTANAGAAVDSSTASAGGSWVGSGLPGGSANPAAAGAAQQQVSAPNAGTTVATPQQQVVVQTPPPAAAPPPVAAPPPAVATPPPPPPTQTTSGGSTTH